MNILINLKRVKTNNKRNRYNFQEKHMPLTIVGFLIVLCAIVLVRYDNNLLSALFLIVGLAIMKYAHRKNGKPK